MYRSLPDGRQHLAFVRGATDGAPTLVRVQRANLLGDLWENGEPITQKGYYQLFAFFNSDRELDIPAPLPGEAENLKTERASFDEAQARRLFARFGIASARDVIVTSAAEAESAARDLGGRVALKILSAEITHKSDVGGVAVGLDRGRCGRRRGVDLALDGRPGHTHLHVVVDLQPHDVALERVDEAVHARRGHDLVADLDRTLQGNLLALALALRADQQEVHADGDQQEDDQAGADRQHVREADLRMELDHGQAQAPGAPATVGHSPVNVPVARCHRLPPRFHGVATRASQRSRQARAPRG